jgi:hypothetical protein
MVGRVVIWDYIFNIGVDSCMLTLPQVQADRQAIFSAVACGQG